MQGLYPRVHRAALADGDAIANPEAATVTVAATTANFRATLFIYSPLVGTRTTNLVVRFRRPQPQDSLRNRPNLLLDEVSIWAVGGPFVVDIGTVQKTLVESRLNFGSGPSR